MQTLDYFIEPKEEYLKLSNETGNTISRLLATIKSCQQENLHFQTYSEMCHKIVDSFIENPMTVEEEKVNSILEILKGVSFQNIINILSAVSSVVEKNKLTNCLS